MRTSTGPPDVPGTDDGGRGHGIVGRHGTEGIGRPVVGPLCPGTQCRLGCEEDTGVVQGAPVPVVRVLGAPLGETTSHSGSRGRGRSRETPS